MLKIKELSKQFSSTTVVDHVSLDIREGEFFSLLGPSGCGKTTLLRMLAGFETPTSGDMFLNQQRLNDVPPNRRQFNMVFQRYALFPHLDVWNNVAFGLKMKNVGSSEVTSRVSEALALVRMESFSNRHVDRLSGGQQQRVALARALVNRPQVLLLDEPLSALDLKLREQMQWELLRLQRQLKITFIFVTHDQDEAMSLSDRIAVMNHGRIEQIGSPREIYENPKTEFVAQFIGSINAWTGTVQSIESHCCQLALTSGHGTILSTAHENAALVVGQNAKAFVRPEKIRIGSYSDLGHSPNSLPGRVKHVIFKGPMTELAIESFGQDYNVIRPSHEAGPARPGDVVCLTWAPEHCFVLPGVEA